ncbi:MAG: RsmD family RNA methyltransferase [Alphaproteobacteria bacterium]|nr:RsmD family RNA methyltransferase [Alphaproteobacteria bacterium]
MRIISGIARGKKLFSPTTEATQPTMDRAKETLFNMLESWRLKEGKGWGQLSFLDVFAGSGSIGIEAWSRGVKSPYFMENDADALKVLNQNLALVKLPKITAIDALNPPLAPRAVSIAFMDAPYGQGLWAAALPKLIQAGWIDNNTLIVVETDKKAPEIVPDGFVELKERAAGRNLFLFIKQGDAE